VALSERLLDQLIFGDGGPRRFTQDSPVYPDVWRAYASRPHEPLDLLLTPHERHRAGELACALRERLRDTTAEHETQLAYTNSYVAARLDFAQLLRGALPLTLWWRERLFPDGKVRAAVSAAVRAAAASGRPRAGARRRAARAPSGVGGRQLIWFVRLAGRIAAERAGATLGLDEQLDDSDAAAALLALLDRMPAPPEATPLWSISHNRTVSTTLWRSRQAVKADAAARLFEPDLDGLGWAVIDTGIDAGHTAFRDRARFGADEWPSGGDPQRSHVAETYDFTRMRVKQAIVLDAEDEARDDEVALPQQLADGLRSGRQIDFGLMARSLQVPHGRGYDRPRAVHGTHVAGIVAGDWRAEDPDATLEDDVVGVAPGLRLYDLRVLDDEGLGEEYAVLAALAYVRWRNEQSDRMIIHGVNLSLALEHDVRNFACGRTPICDEVERVVATGVVVVVAAGNLGWTRYDDGRTESDGYRAISITDPGNAERAITVGSTHRSEPHAYGVSYFSSRGPTGDGRDKPDLVAPGEKITAPVPGAGALELDGTSMAAPHVSGAAALLLARHRELIGRPDEVKRILCDSATDLGRRTDFQGAGMVDVLRALQAL
jgi:subtilisin family serine protease